MLYEAGLRNVQFDDPGMACKSHSISCVMSMSRS